METKAWLEWAVRQRGGESRAILRFSNAWREIDSLIWGNSKSNLEAVGRQGNQSSWGHFPFELSGISSMDAEAQRKRVKVIEMAFRAKRECASA